MDPPNFNNGTTIKKVKILFESFPFSIMVIRDHTFTHIDESQYAKNQTSEVFITHQLVLDISKHLLDHYY